MQAPLSCTSEFFEPVENNFYQHNSSCFVFLGNFKGFDKMMSKMPKIYCRFKDISSKIAYFNELRSVDSMDSKEKKIMQLFKSCDLDVKGILIFGSFPAEDTLLQVILKNNSLFIL